MADEKELRYTMRMVDNVSATSREMTASQKELSASMGEANRAVNEQRSLAGTATTAMTGLKSEATGTNQIVQEGTAALNEQSMAAVSTSMSQKELSTTIGTTTKSLDSQNISFLTQMGAIGGIHMGIRSLTMSFTQLGIVQGDAAKAMQGLNYAVTGVFGAFELARGAAKAIEMVKEANLGLAAVEVFRATLKNPAMLAMVGLAAGAAVGVGAYFMTQPQHQSAPVVNQTVNFNGASQSSDTRSMQRASFEAAGGF